MNENFLYKNIFNHAFYYCLLSVINIFFAMDKFIQIRFSKLDVRDDKINDILMPLCRKNPLHI